MTLSGATRRTRPRVVAVISAPGTLAVAGGLLSVAALAWLLLLRDASSMTMPASHSAPSLADGARFTSMWGVMMAAMMLPSALPTVLLYHTVRRRLTAQGDRAVPVALFVGVYLALWFVTGVPVYAAHIAVVSSAARWPQFDAMLPYAVAGVLGVAGAYQFTAAKHACLRHCESPLSFLMRRWRSGYAATLRLAVAHGGYCIGCCWGLMAILVAAGAMSLPWVVAITLVVLAEKMFPDGRRTARVVGAVLLALAAAVALRPELAGSMIAYGGQMSSRSF